MLPKKKHSGPNKDLKSVDAKHWLGRSLSTLQQYGPPTLALTDIQKVEAVQRRAARWVYRDYSYTSRVTAMMKDLNWLPLDQRCIDSHLKMLYKVICDLVQHFKVTYDLAAIPASQYLTHNTRLSRHIHPLSYRFPLLMTITVSHFPKVNYSLECPASPHTRRSSAVLFCQVIYVSP